MQNKVTGLCDVKCDKGRATHFTTLVVKFETTVKVSPFVRAASNGVFKTVERICKIFRRREAFSNLIYLKQSSKTQHFNISR